MEKYIGKPINLIRLSRIISSTKNSLEFLQATKVLPKEYTCECGQKVTKTVIRNTRSYFKCKCLKQSSTRKGTFLYQSNITNEIFIYLGYIFANMNNLTYEQVCFAVLHQNKIKILIILK